MTARNHTRNYTNLTDATKPRSGAGVLDVLVMQVGGGVMAPVG